MGIELAESPRKNIKKSKLILWILLSTSIGLIPYSVILVYYAGIINFSIVSRIVFIAIICLLLATMISLRLYDLGSDDYQLNSGKVLSQKLKTHLWVIIAFLTGLTLLSTSFIYSGIPFTALFIELVCLVVWSLVILKYYDLQLVCYLIIFFGLFVKRLHWNLAAEEMTIGILLLNIVSLFISWKFIISFRNNAFLKWFGSVAGIIITIFMTGVLYMNLHWSGTIRVICIFSGFFLFLIYVFAFVFTLPNSNFIAWTKLERKVFYRTVLVPMTFVFAFITLIVVFPGTYRRIMGMEGSVKRIYPYEIDDVRLLNLEGIKQD